MLEALRLEVHRLNLELPRNGLVAWTSGNVSARDPSTGLVVIKPSGVRYDDLTPTSLVVVDGDGHVVEGALRPSSDTASHLVIYRDMPGINGVVHTHSTFATAFAAIGRPIPAYLTAIADEFGGPIPCASYAPVGGDEIGRAVVEGIGESSAILLMNHGVFAVGESAEEAVKAAVMVEDAARTVFYALQLGEPLAIPDQEIERARRRYLNDYGQPVARSTRGDERGTAQRSGR
jgi:L-ribulose-5-phosphate 4-epimerase